MQITTRRMRQRTKFNSSAFEENSKQNFKLSDVIVSVPTHFFKVNNGLVSLEAEARQMQAGFCKAGSN